MQLGVERLTFLLKHITLRRSCRDTVSLPKRIDEIHYLDFSPEERLLYEQTKCAVIDIVDHALYNREKREKNTYFNALQWINSLRMLCNLGTTTRIASQRNYLSESWNERVAQDTFNNLLTVGDTRCHRCSNDIEAFSDEQEIEGGSSFIKPVLYRCLSLVCGACSGRGATCEHNPACPSAPVIPDNSNSSREANLSSLNSNGGFSSKVQALISDLKSMEPGAKRQVLITLLDSPSN